MRWQVEHQFLHIDLESGIIEYMKSTNAAMVCTEKEHLVEAIERLITDQKIQKEYYDQAIVMTREHHNLQKTVKHLKRLSKKQSNI